MGASLARMKAYDRRLTAIHEAGHAVIALNLGYGADAWIYPHETDDPIGEKTWLGHMILRNGPSEDPLIHRRLVAVAGMVAETLWKHGHDPDYAESYGWEDHLMDDESMSYSDWRMADAIPGEPDEDLYDVVTTVARLLMGELWPVLTDVSRILMGDPDRVHGFNVPSAEHAA